jgi:hypothetical protein
VLLFAQAADPVSDRLRFEIALAQRDYVIAKQQLDVAAARLKEAVEKAEKACSSQKASFDAEKFFCKPSLESK